MKEFEKRHTDFNCELQVNCADLDCDECKKIRAEEWKAALEWILDEGISDWIEDSIREELEQ